MPTINGEPILHPFLIHKIAHQSSQADLWQQQWTQEEHKIR